MLLRIGCITALLKPCEFKRTSELANQNLFFSRICREKIYREGLFREAEVLLKVQCCLQDVGSHIATPSDASKIKQGSDSNFFPWLQRSLCDSLALSRLVIQWHATINEIIASADSTNFLLVRENCWGNKSIRWRKTSQSAMYCCQNYKHLIFVKIKKIKKLEALMSAKADSVLRFQFFNEN